MLFRVIAVAFAFFLSASAFAAPEGDDATGSASFSVFVVSAADAPSQPQPGDVPDERPLDDQPGQSQSEGAIDPPALMMARPDAKAPSLTMSRPRPYAMAAWRAPYLDGPQRPPCAALFSA